jgi:hypothetical protein
LDFCHPYSTIAWLSKTTTNLHGIFCYPYSTIPQLSKNTTNLHGIFCHPYSTIPWLSRESQLFTTTGERWLLA